MAKIIAKLFMLSARCITVLFVIGLSAVSAFSQTVYSGEDIVATTSSSHPSSDGAAASFDTAAAGIGNVSLINFESAPLGSFSNLTIAPGVTINGSDINLANQTILNVPNASLPTLYGFNTTSGGANFLNMQGGTVTFSFATPIQFFGAYFTGIQTVFFADSVTFSDGTMQTLLIPGTGTSSSAGAVSFVGFTDAGKSISSVTINAGNNGFDDIGVDDVRFQSTTPTPEPPSIFLCLGGLLLAGIKALWPR